MFRTIECETQDINVLYPKLESLAGEKEVIFHNAPPTFSFIMKKGKEKEKES